MNRAHTLLSWLLFLAALLVPLPTFAATLSGKVVKVADGDTITILVGKEQHRIRLQGIDAPERKQPYGRASGRSLSALVAGKQVRVEYDKRDRYGRIVGVVWVRSPNAQCDAKPCPMTLDAGAYQIIVGMAWWYRHYAKEQTPEQRGLYELAEAEAKTKRAGLWQEPDAVAPWEWRKGEPDKVIAETGGKVIGNRRSNIYHLPKCPDYALVAKRNRVLFDTEDAAKMSGFRIARNCP